MQQPFHLLIFLNQPYMFRATNSPILRSTFWLYIQLFGTMHRHCCRPVSRLRWNVSSISISPTCFGRQIRPSSGALFDCIYSFCCRPVPRLRWNWRSISTVAPPPADLNRIFLITERRNLVSVRVPSHFKRSLFTFFRYHVCSAK